MEPQKDRNRCQSNGRSPESNSSLSSCEDFRFVAIVLETVVIFIVRPPLSGICSLSLEGAPLSLMLLPEELIYCILHGKDIMTAEDNYFAASV
jgi:hypothetical protein